MTMTVLKATFSDELIDDMKTVHGIDIVDMVKSKLEELELVWTQKTHPDNVLVFTMFPYWRDNEFMFQVTKSIVDDPRKNLRHRK